MKQAKMTAKEYREYLRGNKARRAGNKYRAKPTVVGKVRYASRLEAHVARALEARLAKGAFQKVERQVPVDLWVGDTFIGRYVVDFLVTNRDQSTTYVEAKGVETAEWRMKWRLLIAHIEELRKLGHIIRDPEVWRRAKRAKPKVFFSVTTGLQALNENAVGAIVNEQGRQV